MLPYSFLVLWSYRVANQRKFSEKVKLSALISLLKLFFHIEKHLLKIKHINYPQSQFILSMMHCHQCLVYGIQDKASFYALISASNDGEIIAKAAESLNIKSVRGSSKRRGVAASLELIDKLKEGNSAGIMIDGPRGPRGKVKDGIVNISKLTGVPIIPVAWHSKNKTFFAANSWDKFIIPFGPCKTVALYGEPISIPFDLEKEDIKFWCEKIENEMQKLQNDLEENYDKYLKA